jgi:predicted AAA+ superfamily ATPase
MNVPDFPSDLILRESYMNRLEPFIRKQIVKVFTGQRRVGKSFILYQIIQRITEQDPQANIIYVNKEDDKYDSIRTYKDLINFVESGKNNGEVNYIFIDEIQEISEFEKAVRSLLLDRKNDLYITGSNAQVFSSEIATLLGGRIVEFNIHSLSYSEFLYFHKIEDSKESLGKYFVLGGMPFLVNLGLDEKVAAEYLKNLYTTIVYRDIVSRNRVRSTWFLEQLIHYLADTTGSLFSAKSISDYLKSQKIRIPHNQVQTFIGYMSDAYLVHRVPRYDIIGKRLFETGEKFYFEDLGLRNSLSGYRPGDLGKILENAVHNELLFRGYTVRTGWKGNHETDFIATRDNETVYIQVAWTLDSEATVEREFGNLLEIDDNYPKMVVSADEQFKNTIKGVKHLNIRQFLTTDIV